MSIAYYLVTSVDADTFEESLPTAPIGPLNVGTEDLPTTLTWDAVDNARSYNIYRSYNSVYAFIGVAGSGLSFIDNGITPDPAVQPPVIRDALSGTNNRPSVATYYQQRLMVANTESEPEAVFGSRSGLFDNFTISSPLRPDDAIKFSMADVEVQEVRHLLGAMKLLMVLTGNSVRRIVGDINGVLRPDAINPVQQSGFGSSWVPPVVVGETAVYVETAGSMVRDLNFEQQSDGYVGKDLTIFSPHLFEGFTIVRMAYAKTPHSILYLVRSDGVLLTLTYIREQELWGWARHDTDGFYEDVMTLPEGGETAVYVVVRRTVLGETKRFIERFTSASIGSDFTRNAETAFLDSFLTYDGRNSGSRTMTLTGTDWEGATEDLTLTASSAFFSSIDVGNVIVMRATDPAGATVSVRLAITSYSSTTVVGVRPAATVPPELRAIATADWDRAVDQVAGLDHLEGELVDVVGDGKVLASQYVVDGGFRLDSQYTIIHAGLGYNSDFETLDLDVAGTDVGGRQKKINSIQVKVKNSRGFFAGPTVDDLNEWRPDFRASYADDETALISGLMEMNISSTWNNTGRFFIRQSKPLPLTILSATPDGEIGG